jgi:hypothetical protein
MADDMPYDRIRERIGRSTGGEQLVDPEVARKAREWEASFAAARDLCFAGRCERDECEGGRRCPFTRPRQ